MSVLIDTDGAEGLFYPAAENQSPSRLRGYDPALAGTWRSGLRGNPLGAGERLQQGGAAIQQPENASVATCSSGAGLHMAACVSRGAKAAGAAPGHLPFRHQGQVGTCRGQHAVLSPLPRAGLGLTGWLSAVGARDPGVVALLGPQPASGSCAEARLCAHVYGTHGLLCSSIQCMKIHRRRALFCLCLYYPCSNPTFFEGTSALRDADGHLGSSEQRSRHHTLFSGSPFSNPVL